MAALRSRCGHYIFALWFLVSSFFFFSSPNLSGRILDVCHTCTHGVASVRISDAGLKPAACGSLQIRDAKIVKKSPSGHHRTTLGYISSQLRHVSTIGKKLVKHQYLVHMSPQYGELRRTSGWDRSGSLGHPCKFQRVSRPRSVTARHSSIGRQPHFAALKRGRHLYSAGRLSRWALAHISSHSCFAVLRLIRQHAAFLNSSSLVA